MVTSSVGSEQAPSDAYQARFKGWLPTVSGRLSFSIFGHTDHPRNAITANVSDTKSRYLICYQKRELLDAPLKSLATKLFGLHGKFWFVLQASADDVAISEDSDLTGHLFIFHDKQAWRTDAEPAVRNAQSYLREFESDHPKDDLATYFQEVYQKVTLVLCRSSSFHVHVRVRRDGETTIDVPRLTSLSSHSPTFPAAEPRRVRLVYTVVSQLFYFLRDVGHIHQHHDPYTDTLIDIYPFDGSDDFAWRCETLRMLYRKVLEFKRRREEEIYSSSLGVLAYAKAFERISNQQISASGAVPKEIGPQLFQDLLQESILASQAALRNTVQEGIRQSDTYRNTVISVLTILLALVGLLQISSPHPDLVSPNANLIWLGNMLLRYPLRSAVAVGIFVMFILHLLNVIDIERWKPVRGVMRIVQTFGKRKAGCALIAGGIAIAGFTMSYVTPFDFGGLLSWILQLLSVDG
jgi:hypothetical protein